MIYYTNRKEITEDLFRRIPLERANEKSLCHNSTVTQAFPIRYSFITLYNTSIVILQDVPIYFEICIDKLLLQCYNN